MSEQKMGVCAECNAIAMVEWAPDPVAEELGGGQIGWQWWCDSCLGDRQQDI